jgi:hypothetical protein
VVLDADTMTNVANNGTQWQALVDLSITVGEGLLILTMIDVSDREGKTLTYHDRLNSFLAAINKFDLQHSLPFAHLQRFLMSGDC